MIPDDSICYRLRTRDYAWFYTQEGRDAVAALYPQLAPNQRAELEDALVQRDYSTINMILKPVVCGTTTPTHDKPKKDVPGWLIPLVIAILLLLLLWWLLASCMDDWQRKNHEYTSSPSPTATTTVSPSPATQTFVVLFNPGESTLDSQDQLVISEAEKAFVNAGEGWSFHIVGKADGTGNPQSNEDLAAKRAKAVHDDIVADGYKDVAITTDTEVPTTGGSDQKYRTADILVIEKK